MKKILIAIDDTKSSEAVVPVFYDLTWMPDTVILLYVSRLEGKSLMIDMLGDAELSTLKEMLEGTSRKEELDRKAERVLDYYKSRIQSRGSVEVRTIKMEGVPSEEILKIAREENVEMIILGHSGTKGLNRLILGNTAKTVQRSSKVPVLVAKRAVMKAKAEIFVAFSAWILTAALFMFFVLEFILQK